MGEKNESNWPENRKSIYFFVFDVALQALAKIVTGSVLVLSEFLKNNKAEKVFEEMVVENFLNLTKVTNLYKIQEV